MDAQHENTIGYLINHSKDKKLDASRVEMLKWCLSEIKELEANIATLKKKNEELGEKFEDIADDR